MPYTLRLPRLWYERRGRGETLLCITGFGISAAVFDPVADLYEDRFDLIRFDNRSSGRSTGTAWPTSIPQLAGDAVALLDELGVDSAHVLGVSMGGMIAQEVAIRFPERVRGLVLGCTTPGGPLAARPALGEVAALLADATRAFGEPGRPWLGALLFSPEFRRERPERVRELLGYFARHRSSPLAVTAQFWASVYHDTVSRLGRIQAPTLVLHGERDVLSPLGNARLLAGAIPDAELAVVPAAGHAYALEQPEESLRLLGDWLVRRGPVAPGRPHTGIAARTEPLTRALGLPMGAIRTTASLVRRGRDAGRGRRARMDTDEGGSDAVALDRRAA